MRAAFVQNIMDTECGQAKNVDDDADHDAADQGPWGVLFGSSGGLTCTGPVLQKCARLKQAGR